MKICLIAPILALLIVTVFSHAQGQDALVICGTEPNTDTVLMMVGGGTQGLIIPITNDHNSIAKTAGMVVYNSADNMVYYCDGNSWRNWGVNVSVTARKGNNIIAPNEKNTNGNSANSINVAATGRRVLTLPNHDIYP